MSNNKVDVCNIFGMKLSVVLVVLCCLFAGFSVPSRAGEARPNIVLIMVDDLGYGDLACYGSPDMQTPHIDELMGRGMRFDQFYANCTVCSPTRASLMTGLYPDKAGVPGVVRQWAEKSWGYLDPAAPTLPGLLKKAGYHTALVGKWHLGLKSPNTPNERGFDHFHGFLNDMMDDYYTHKRGGGHWMRLNDKPVHPKGHATDIFSAWAIDYINKQAVNEDSPFFLLLAYNAPHFPIQPPEDWLAKTKAREPQLPEDRAKNVAFIEHLDHNIGKVVRAIDDVGITKETIVIFTSDNGGSLAHAQRNLPLRGGKQEHYEGGIRVPTCVVWPGQVPVKRSEALGMTMDLMPTLCEIADVEIEYPIDGQSLAPIWLRGEAGDMDRTMIWVRREGGNRYIGGAYYAIRQGRWKLLQNAPGEAVQLFDIVSDPYERAPVKDQPKTVNQLKGVLMRHIQQAGKVPWQE